MAIFLTKKHQFGYILLKKHHLVIFSAKNCQFNTFLKTRTRTRLTGFLKIKTRNPLFQNPTPVLTSLWTTNPFSIVCNSLNSHKRPAFTAKKTWRFKLSCCTQLHCIVQICQSRSREQIIWDLKKSLLRILVDYN